MIDESTAQQGVTSTLGDTIGVQASGPGPDADLRHRPLRRRGRASAARRSSGFDLPTAQRLFDRIGQARPDPREGEARCLAGGSSCDEIQRDPPAAHAGEAAASAGEVGRDGHRTLPQLPPGPSCSRSGSSPSSSGSFVIANSLSITIAQRTRELATLRTLGATRRQVQGSDLGRGARDGDDSPRSSGSSSASDSASVSSGCSTRSASRCRTTGSCSRRGRSSSRCSRGSSSTVVASFVPALRATRVPPIAAVREGAQLPPGRFAKYRTLGSAILDHTRLRRTPPRAVRPRARNDGVLLFMGVGTLLIFIGVALLSARIVRPLAWALGAARRKLRRRRRVPGARQLTAEPAADGARPRRR